jgi:HEPN domain-containing protein
MDKEVRNWLDSAGYDLETAEHMFKTGRYVYTIFMCHLALEKILKAKVQEITGRIPPKTHNLRYLVNLSKLEVPEDMFEFLSKLSDVSIPTRYPKDFSKLIESYNKEVATNYLKTSREVFEWIRRLLKQ